MSVFLRKCNSIYAYVQQLLRLISYNFHPLNRKNESQLLFQSQVGGLPKYAPKRNLEVGDAKLLWTVGTSMQLKDGS